MPLVYLIIAENIDCASFHLYAHGMGTKGVIIGRFNPPHNGHRYLIDFAVNFCEELYIFVCTLDRDEIPGTQRFKWMQMLYPQAHCIHITEENPDANRHRPGAQKIWARAISEHVDNIDFLFASEEYGWDLANELNCEFIPVDPNRDQLPVSGSDIRLHPLEHWDFLPEIVRVHYLKRIVIVASEDGPALARSLAAALKTVYAPEYSRFHADFTPSKKTSLNSRKMTLAQKSLEASLSNRARRFLITTIENFTSSDKILIVESSLDEKKKDALIKNINSSEDIAKKTSYFHWSDNIIEHMKADVLRTFSLITE